MNTYKMLVKAFYILLNLITYHSRIRGLPLMHQDPMESPPSGFDLYTEVQDERLFKQYYQKLNK